MKKILSVIGTRPEAIKMAPIVKQIEKYSECFESVVCVTGQHREMLDKVLDLFDIVPDYDLNLMQRDQSLASLTSDIFLNLDGIVKKCAPDCILAQGDTTTVMSSALIAFYNGIQFGHVEAGLRTQSILSPFPEEANRRIADILTTHYFAPTTRAKSTLISEKVNQKNIYVTGNTVIDALYYVSGKYYDWSIGLLKGIPRSKKLILVTTHRRESFGDGLEQICKAIKIISEQLIKKNYHIVFPVHLNPNVQIPVRNILTGHSNISLIEPLDYLSMVNLLKNSFIVLTDSGGIQEEAPGLGIPVLVMRNETERPEGVKAGVVKLVGRNMNNIINETMNLIKNEEIYLRMAKKTYLYGDGKSAERIICILKNALYSI